MTKQVRQGDVLLIAVPESAIPTLLVSEPRSRTDGVVLAHGEITGHAHVVRSDRATRFRDDAGGAFLHIAGSVSASLVHEEHATISLAPGWYRQIGQREYRPEGVKSVVD